MRVLKLPGIPLPKSRAHDEPSEDAELAQLLDRREPDSLAATPVPLPFARGELLAGVVDRLLSVEEATQLIELTTRRGYEAALVNVGFGRQRKMDDVRRSGRCILDSPTFARELWRRLAPLLPAYHDGDGDGRGVWVPVGLNERFRFLRYEPGDYFRPHQDGSYPRPLGHPDFGDRSLVTLMIYLDTPARGGETNFLNDHDGRATSVVPCAGLGLFFDHVLVHEGAAVREGIKHAVRTDVMYRRVARPPHARPVPTGAPQPGCGPS